MAVDKQVRSLLRLASYPGHLQEPGNEAEDLLEGLLPYTVEYMQRVMVQLVGHILKEVFQKSEVFQRHKLS